MKSREESIEIASTPEAVFDLIHDYDRRLEWDPFLKEARLIDASKAALGVRSLCVARNSLGGLGMETVYVAFDRPRIASVRMTRGPRILRSFAATLRQEGIGDGRTRVTYKFNLEARPRWLSRLLTPVCNWVFRQEVRKRLKALKRFLEQAPSPR
jgi:hypothetical protein